MSTAIYSGIRINMNIFGLNKLVAELRETISNQTQALKSDWFSEQISQTLDLQIAKGEAYDESKFKDAFLKAREEWDAKQADIKKGYRSPSVDFEFKLAVYPHKNRLYGRYFCEHKSMVDMLISRPEIEEYHYQNSTDRPDNISVSQWRVREKTWDAIFKDIHNSGFVADMSDPYRHMLYDIDIVQIRAQLPSMKQRTEYVAQIIVADRMPREFYNDSRGEFSFSKYMEHMSSDEFKKQHAEEVTRLLTILPSAY